MSKDAVSDWDSDPDQNTDIGGIALGEGAMHVNQVNNAIREVMAQVAAAGFLTSTTPVFADNVFFITGSSDATKKLAFEVDGFTTGTTRTVTVPDASVTMAALDLEDQTISGGARVTVKSLGNLSGNSITPDPGDRPKQKITNNGAGSILPGSNNGDYLLEVINTTGAGAITTTGWTLKGDSFDTTTTSKFLCSCHVSSDQKLMVITKTA